MKHSPNPIAMLLTTSVLISGACWAPSIYASSMNGVQVAAATQSAATSTQQKNWKKPVAHGKTGSKSLIVMNGRTKGKDSKKFPGLMWEPKGKKGSKSFPGMDWRSKSSKPKKGSSSQPHH